MKSLIQSLTRKSIFLFLIVLFSVSFLQKVFGQRQYVAGNFTLMLDDNNGGWIRKAGNTLIFKVPDPKDTVELRKRNEKIIRDAKLPYSVKFEIDSKFQPRKNGVNLLSALDTLPKVKPVTVMEANTRLKPTPPVGFSVIRTARINIRAGEETRIIAFTEKYDDGDHFSNNRFTAPFNGVYHFDAHVDARISNDLNFMKFILRHKNAAGEIVDERSSFENRDQDRPRDNEIQFVDYSLYSFQISCDLKLKTGDYIELYVMPSEAGGYIENTWFDGHKVY